MSIFVICNATPALNYFLEQADPPLWRVLNAEALQQNRIRIFESAEEANRVMSSLVGGGDPRQHQVCELGVVGVLT